MATQFVRLSRVLAAAALVLAGGPSALAQGAARGEDEDGPTKTIQEVRGLVAELESNAERQRALLQGAEASLAKARALLRGLEGEPKADEPPPSQGLEQGRQAPPWVRDDGRLPHQTAAEEKAWRWSDERADVKAGARELGGGYHARIEPVAGKSETFKFTLTRDGNEVHSWEGHEHSVFVVARDVLYRADFNPRRSGCAVVALDLKTGKPLWRTDLWTIPVMGHSMYGNRVNLEVDDRHLTVYGNESMGRYLELVDLKTGRIVGYRMIDVADGLVPTAR